MKKPKMKKSVGKKLSQVDSQKLVVTNIKPIKLANLSVEDLCLMELISEESEKAELEGHNRLTLTRDRLDAKIVEKLREKKETGKVSTFLTEGQFSTGT